MSRDHLKIINIYEGYKCRVGFVLLLRNLGKVLLLLFNPTAFFEKPRENF
jgi:hypothetical protein